MLKGYVYEHRGAKYLEAKEQIPAGGSDWQPVKEGCWMPFEGGGNGGRWLHDPDTLKAKGGAPDDACRRY